MKKLLMIVLVALGTVSANKAAAESGVIHRVRVIQNQHKVATAVAKLNWFWNVGVECNSAGEAGVVKRFLGIAVVREKTVPNSALCQ